MTTKSTINPVCQRGVDGSPGCEHFEPSFNYGLGICTADLHGLFCRHVCDFSPALPVGDEKVGRWYVCGDCGWHRVALTVSSPSNFICRRCFSTNGIPPTDAPVHKVGEPPSIPSGWIYEDELGEVTKEFYAAWFPLSRVIDGVRMGPPHRELETAEPQPATLVEPPTRVWIEWREEGIGVARGPFESGVEFIPVAPVRAALEACRADGDSDYSAVIIRTPLWKALTAAINGEK